MKMNDWSEKDYIHKKRNEAYLEYIGWCDMAFMGGYNLPDPEDDPWFDVDQNVDIAVLKKWLYQDMGMGVK